MWICSIFASVRTLPAVQPRTGWIFLPWPSVSPQSVKVSQMHKESQSFLFFTESGSRKQKIFGEFLTETNDSEEKSVFFSWICFFFSDQLKIKHTMSSRTVGNLKLLSVSTVWWTFWWFFVFLGFNQTFNSLNMKLWDLRSEHKPLCYFYSVYYFDVSFSGALLWRWTLQVRTDPVQLWRVVFCFLSSWVLDVKLKVSFSLFCDRLVSPVHRKTLTRKTSQKKFEPFHLKSSGTFCSDLLETLLSQTMNI